MVPPAPLSPQDPAFFGYRPAQPLSLIQLVEAGSLDLSLASLLWVAMEQRASLIIAGGPRLVGKTTYLAALQDFLPPDVHPVYTRGQAEDLSFLQHTEPLRTYILVNELSNHLPLYLWGPRVGKLFWALTQGYRMATTMHAETPEAVLALLRSPELEIAPELLLQLHLILTLIMDRREGRTSYRVSQLALVVPGSWEARSLTTLARWEPFTGSFRHLGEEKTARLLARRLEMDPSAVMTRWSSRQQALEQLLAAGLRSPEAVRHRVQELQKAGM